MSLYTQARESIRQMIVDGMYAPSDRLPSESEFAEQFGVHRLTARRALEKLARECVAVARKGSGTFVAPSRLTCRYRCRSTVRRPRRTCGVSCERPAGTIARSCETSPLTIRAMKCHLSGEGQGSSAS